MYVYVCTYVHTWLTWHVYMWYSTCHHMTTHMFKKCKSVFLVAFLIKLRPISSVRVYHGTYIYDIDCTHTCLRWKQLYFIIMWGYFLYYFVLSIMIGTGVHRTRTFRGCSFWCKIAEACACTIGVHLTWLSNMLSTSFLLFERNKLLHLIFQFFRVLGWI